MAWSCESGSGGSRWSRPSVLCECHCSLQKAHQLLQSASSKPVASVPLAVLRGSPVYEPGGGFSCRTFLSRFKYILKVLELLLCIWSRGDASRCLLAALLWPEDFPGRASVSASSHALCFPRAAAPRPCGANVEQRGLWRHLPFPEWECFQWFTVRCRASWRFLVGVCQLKEVSFCSWFVFLLGVEFYQGLLGGICWNYHCFLFNRLRVGETFLNYR